MIRNPKDLPRYTAFERSNHWTVAICLVLVALSGLAFFHPLFWPLSQLFGGGVWARILHPFIGLLLVISFISMFFQFRKLNSMRQADWEWIKRLGQLMRTGNESIMPPQEKYNGGQKLFFWGACVCLLLMVLSGLLMWRAYFTFPITLVRFAAVIHAVTGALIIALVMIHVYAAIWTSGTIHAMLYGSVNRAWAKQHYEIWYRQMMGR